MCEELVGIFIQDKTIPTRQKWLKKLSKVFNLSNARLADSKNKKVREIIHKHARLVAENGVPA